MKNLKKVLALVMAFAMAFTMMAGAAFTDSADIKATEAVDMLNQLGVVSGNPDGSFKPNGTVTRAEMATMIYIIRNGGNKDASSFAGMQTTFKDVDGHWAAGYIKYCQSVGIISGKSATQFDPNANVTGVEAALMCLRVMGYEPAKVGIGGSTWSITTIGLASQNGILEDVDTSITAALPRQFAAQMMYNMLDTDCVLYSNDKEAFVKDTYTSGNNTNTYTVGSKYMGLQEWIGTFVGNEKSLGTLKSGQVQVSGSIDGLHKTSLVVATAANFKSDLDLMQYIGEDVSVMFKDGKGGLANKPDDNDLIYGIRVTGDTTSYIITKGDLQTSSESGKVKFNDKHYAVKSTGGTIDVNYGATATATLASDTTFVTAIQGYKVNSNDAIKFVTDDDGKIVKAYVETAKFGKVSSVTSTKIAVEGLGSKDLADCSVYEGVKAGDVVKYTETYASGNRVNIIEKADVVSGKIDSFKSSDSQVQVGGSWYKYDSHNATVATDYTAGALASGDVSATVDLIVDGGYYVAYNKTSNFNNFAVVTTGTSEFGDTRVKVLKADGTETTAVKKDLNDGAALAGLNSSKLFAYDLVSDGAKVNLSAKDYATATAAAGDKYISASKTIVVNGSAKAVDPNAAAFVYSTNAADLKWRAYTAKDLGDFNVATGSTIETIIRSGKVVAFAVFAGNFPTGGSSSTGFGYVTNSEFTKIGDDNVVRLTIWNGTEDVIVNIDGSTSTAYKGDFVEYPLVADSAKVSNSDVKVETGHTYTAVKVKSIDTANKQLIVTTDAIAPNGTVVAGADTAYALTSDTKYIGVKTDDAKSSTMNSVVAYTKSVGDDFTNALVVLEAKTGYSEVKAIFIDEDGKLIPYATGTKGTAVGAPTVYNVAPAAVTGANGLTATVAADKATAIAGETVTVTVTVSGTAAAAGTINVSGVTATAITAGTITNATVNGTTGMNVTGAAATAGTFTYTYTMGAANSAPTVVIA